MLKKHQYEPVIMTEMQQTSTKGKKECHTQSKTWYVDENMTKTIPIQNGVQDLYSTNSYSLMLEDSYIEELDPPILNIKHSLFKSTRLKRTKGDAF